MLEPTTISIHLIDQFPGVVFVNSYDSLLWCSSFLALAKLMWASSRKLSGMMNKRSFSISTLRFGHST